MASPRLPRPAGLHRRRDGSALSWADDEGRPVDDPDTLARLRALAVPPAWEHVWAATDPSAAVQATGLDVRGRTQYRYLPEVSAARARDKFDHVVEFAAALPALRRAVSADLRHALAAPSVTRPAVLGAMVRLLDLGFFRVGNERYARDNHTYGLTTLRRDQVAVSGARLHFDYVAKEHLHRVVEIEDAPTAHVVADLLAAPGDPADPVFVVADEHGRRTHVDSATVNAYLHARLRLPATAKAFRTWAGTVVAAASMAGAELPGAVRSRTPPARAIAAAAALLGNTPAVARASYVHPAVLAAGADPDVTAAVDAVSEREGHRDLRRVWLDAGVQGAVHDLLAGARRGPVSGDA